MKKKTGIYAYWDNELSQYAYVGKDSNINIHQRHNHHKSPSGYKEQPFNRILQNNPDRYEYRVLMEGDYTNKQLNKMEQFLIKYLKTFYYDYPERNVFNFTKGGEGHNGYKRSESLKRIQSEKMSGEFHPNFNHDINREEIVRLYCEENMSSIKIAEKFNIDKTTVLDIIHNSLSDEDFKMFSSRVHSNAKTNENHPQWKDYARIIKSGFDKGKQVYQIKYCGKCLKRSISIDKLTDWFMDNYPNEKLINGGLT